LVALASDFLSDALDHPFDHPDDPSVSVWTDEASNVSRLDPSGAVQVDAEHPARNRKVEDEAGRTPRRAGYRSLVVGRLREECLGALAVQASTRDEPVHLSDSRPETHQHCPPADANCCHSLLLDPNAMIRIDLRKWLFLLVTGRGEYAPEFSLPWMRSTD
jgi:hypothetical protein